MGCEVEKVYKTDQDIKYFTMNTSKNTPCVNG